MSKTIDQERDADAIRRQGRTPPPQKKAAVREEQPVGTVVQARPSQTESPSSEPAKRPSPLDDIFEEEEDDSDTFAWHQRTTDLLASAFVLLALFGIVHMTMRKATWTVPPIGFSQPKPSAPLARAPSATEPAARVPKSQAHVPPPAPSTKAARPKSVPKSRAAKQELTPMPSQVRRGIIGKFFGRKPEGASASVKSAPAIQPITTAKQTKTPTQSNQGSRKTVVQIQVPKAQNAQTTQSPQPILRAKPASEPPRMDKSPARVETPIEKRDVAPPKKNVQSAQTPPSLGKETAAATHARTIAPPANPLPEIKPQQEPSQSEAAPVAKSSPAVAAPQPAVQAPRVEQPPAQAPAVSPPPAQKGKDAEAIEEANRVMQLMDQALHNATEVVSPSPKKKVIPPPSDPSDELLI